MKKVEFEPVPRKEYSEEMNSILVLYNMDNRDETLESQFDGLKVTESLNLLEEYGQHFEVKRGKIDRRKQKLGYCYHNACRMMKEGYRYVEGIVRTKSSGRVISHAWNVDENGNHFDFTLDYSEDLVYIGIILDEDVVWEIGLNNGGIFHCVLPFIRKK